jgi:hypothetical protein
MNLLLVAYNFPHLEKWKMALNIKDSLEVNDDDILKGFSKIALKVDELVYVDKVKVDWVLYMSKDQDVKFGQFLDAAKYASGVTDTLFFADALESPYPNIPPSPDINSNFYCKPHVFSMLGNLYKLDLSKSKVITDSKSNETTSKLAFGIARFGYDVKTL